MNRIDELLADIDHATATDANATVTKVSSTRMMNGRYWIHQYAVTGIKSAPENYNNFCTRVLALPGIPKRDDQPSPVTIVADVFAEQTDAESATVVVVVRDKMLSNSDL